MIEFTIIFPFAVLFIFGLIQIGLIYMAKLTLNHATFMGARAGSMQNARVSAIRDSVVRGLVPFYQNSATSNLAARVTTAFTLANLDAALFLTVDRISPNTKTFTDFGITVSGQRQIPNDNLAFRNATVRPTSGVNIQDANLLKIRVTYGYQLKIPLMATVVRTVMCGGFTPINAFGGNVSILEALDLGNCPRYYMQGRIPIVSYAVVQMQSPAFP